MESIKAGSEISKREDYIYLTPEERKRELVRIQTLIDEGGQTSEQKAELFCEQALLYDCDEQYARAIASYDKALEIKPDFHAAWYYRGNALAELGLWKEAIASYDKALEIKPDLHEAFYNKACCYALLDRPNLSIQDLQKAIEQNPDKYREMAKTDSDFDSIRSHPKFQELIQG